MVDHTADATGLTAYVKAKTSINLDAMKTAITIIGLAKAVDIEEILKDPSKYEKAYKAYDAGMTKEDYYKTLREFREDILETLRKEFIDRYGDKNTHKES